MSAPKSTNTNQKTTPTYENLFGSDAFYTVPEDRSIFSPGAYFVDLMNLAEKYTQGTATGENPLKARRPDLWNLRLDAQNTDTEVSKLEIVNKVLKNHLRGANLSQMSYPFNLPYNQPLADMRRFLTQNNTGLSNLWQNLELSKGNPLTTEIAREVLGLSPEQWGLYRTPQSSNFELYGSYGLSSNLPAITVLSSLDTFLKQTGLTRDQLDELLCQDLSDAEMTSGLNAKFFINTGTSDPIAIKNDQLTNLTGDRLDHINRFVRLAQAIHWSFTDLDWALRTIGQMTNTNNNGNPIIDDTVLPYLAWMQQQHQNHGLSIYQCCAMIGTLKDSGEKNGPSFFDQIFNNANIPKAPDWVTPSGQYLLTWNLPQSGASDQGNSTDTNIQNALAAALQISQDDLLTIAHLVLSPTGTNPPSLKLSLQNLSLLYRLSLLPILTGMSIKESLLAADLSGAGRSQLVAGPSEFNLSVFNTLTAFTTWLADSPFSLYQLEFILTGKSSDSAIQNSLLGTDAIANFIKGLNAAISKTLLTAPVFFQSIKNGLQQHLSALLNSSTWQQELASNQKTALQKQLTQLPELARQMANDLYDAIKTKAYIDNKGVVLCQNIKSNDLAELISMALSQVFEPASSQEGSSTQDIDTDAGKSSKETTTNTKAQAIENQYLATLAENSAATLNKYYHLQQKTFVHHLAALYHVSAETGEVLQQWGDLHIETLLKDCKLDTTVSSQSLLSAVLSPNEALPQGSPSSSTVGGAMPVMQNLQPLATLITGLALSPVEAAHFKSDFKPGVKPSILLESVQTMYQFKQLVQAFQDTQNTLLSLLETPLTKTQSPPIPKLASLAGWNSKDLQFLINTALSSLATLTVDGVALLQRYFKTAECLGIDVQELWQIYQMASAPQQSTGTYSPGLDTILSGTQAGEITTLSNVVTYQGVQYIGYLDHKNEIYYAQMTLGENGQYTLSNPVSLNATSPIGVALAVGGEHLYVFGTSTKGKLTSWTIVPGQSPVMTAHTGTPDVTPGYSIAGYSYKSLLPGGTYIDTTNNLVPFQMTDESAKNFDYESFGVDCTAGVSSAYINGSIYSAWGSDKGVISAAVLNQDLKQLTQSYHFTVKDKNSVTAQKATVAPNCTPSLLQRDGCLWMAWIGTDHQLYVGIIVNEQGEFLSEIQNLISFGVSSKIGPSLTPEGILYISDEDNLVHLITYDYIDPYYCDKADALWSGLQAQYKAQPKVLAQVQNSLNENRRNQWVLLAMHRLGMATPRDLFEYFLIDVEVSGVVQTSLVREAISAVQLYLYRCLNQLESQISLTPNTSPSLPTLWAWMSSYREWQANREVFVYPENYIQPELRQHKTELFSQLESDLKQLDLNDPDSVNSALRSYMNGFVEITDLEIIGSATLDSIGNKTPTKELCLIGKTSQQPDTYYYRIASFTQSSSGASFEPSNWGQWQKINIHPQPVRYTENTQEGVGAISPLFAFGRWYIFWVEQRQNSGTEKDNSKTYNTTIQYSYLDFNKRWLPAKTLATIDSVSKIQGKANSGIAPLGYSCNEFSFNNKNINCLTKINSTIYIGTETQGLFILQTNGNAWQQASEIPANSNVQCVYEYGNTVYVVTTDNGIYKLENGINNWTQIGGTFSSDCFCLCSFNGNLYVGTSSNGLYRLKNEQGDWSQISEIPASSQVNCLYSFNNKLYAGLDNAGNADNSGLYVFTEDLGTWTWHPVKGFLGQDVNCLGESSGSLYAGGYNGSEVNVYCLTSQSWSISSLPDDASSNLSFFYNYEGTLYTGSSVGLYSLSNGNTWNSIGGNLSTSFNCMATIDNRLYAGTTNGLYQLKQGAWEKVDQWPDTGSPKSVSILYNSHSYDLTGAFNVLAQNETLTIPTIEKSQGNISITLGSTSYPLSSVTTGELSRLLNQPEGVDALLATSTQQGLNPIDFTMDSALFPYFWELFFHVPFLIAKELELQQQFATAKKWYEYIFNPTVGPSKADSNEDEASNDQYWRFVGLRCGSNPLLKKEHLPSASTALAQALESPEALYTSQTDPFDPQAIANLRPIAYQQTIVMHYINNVLQWGDQLFRENTRESILEAELLYVTAYNLLGQQPQNLGIQPLQSSTDYWGLVKAKGSAPTIPYFGIPRNQQFLSYWDKIKAYLYNIRHGLNINGQKDVLPLFEPPINPMQVVANAASGQGVTQDIVFSNSTIPYYRFEVMVEKAKTMTQSVIQLGHDLLSALEQKDTTKLAVLHNTQRQHILARSHTSRQDQYKAATQTIQALQAGLIGAQNRQTHYTNLINAGLSSHEKKELHLQKKSIDVQDIVEGVQSLAGIGFAIPTIFGFSDGGAKPGDVIQQGANIAQGQGGVFGDKSGLTGTVSGYLRRGQDWQLQQSQAQHDVAQIQQQLVAAQYREHLAQQEIELLENNMAQAQQLAAFYQKKFTNEQLYQWYIGQVAGLYFQAYQLAHEMALQAENAWQFEHLGRTPTQDPTGFIKSGYWNSLYEGLLAGESLQLDLQLMEKAFTDQNERRLEIEKTISLAQLDPLALMTLKSTGRCVFDFTEKDFAFDFPGHYCRQIKSLSISLPVVLGPYQNIHATLTQLTNKIVTSDDITKKEAIEYLFSSKAPLTNNEALVVDIRPNQQVALSQGVNDSGLFELNFKDERYLPFEGTGVVSSWQLDLPLEDNAFDFNSLSDVIFQLNYTALPANAQYTQIVKNLRGRFNGYRILSLTQEFPVAWQGLVQQKTPQALAFSVTPQQWRNNGTSYQVTGLSLYCLEAPEEMPQLTLTLNSDTQGTSTTVAFNTWSQGVSIGKADAPGTYPLTIPATKQLWTLALANGKTVPAGVNNLFLIVEYSAGSSTLNENGTTPASSH